MKMTPEIIIDLVLWALALAVSVWAFVNHEYGIGWLGIMVMVILPYAFREDVRAAIRRFRERR